MDHTKHIATFHLPQHIAQLTKVLWAIEGQYPDAFVKSGLYSNVLEVWAPKRAELMILDDEIDVPDEDEIDAAEIAKANGASK